MAIIPAMSYRPLLAFGLASLAACATATPGAEGSDAQGGRDGSTPQDARPDGAPQPDAFCGTIEMELLTNPAFDSTPGNMGWTETRIDQASALVVGTGGATPLSAPNKAWLGGLERPAATNKDALHQDVAIPAGATSLTLTGSSWVASQELNIVNIPFDIGTVELTSTSGNSLEVVIALDNLDEGTAWTAFTKTFANAHAGETVRIRMSSESDATYVTNFYFDSLSLKATVPATACP